MCEFVDMNGKPLEVDDEIEYWGTEREWIIAKVLEIQTVRTMVYKRDEADNSIRVPESKTKILVEVDPRKNPSRGYHMSRIKLQKSANIRKVV